MKKLAKSKKQKAKLDEQPETPPEPKGKGGRTPIPVDEVLLEKLAKLHLSDKVISDCLGISMDTLHRRFAEKIDLWKSQSKSRIASTLFDEAITKREPWALKALAQKHLGYADKAIIESNPLTKVSDDELDRLIAEKQGKK